MKGTLVLGSVAFASLAFACGDDAGRGSGGGAATSTATTTTTTSTTTTATSSASTTTGAGGAGGATSGGGGEGGAPGAGGDGGGCPTTLSDEFDDPCTLAAWTLGGSAGFATHDLDGSTAGALTVTPVQQGGWYATDEGFFLFKMIQGDFALKVAVRAESATTPGDAPGDDWNAAGILVRDPASTIADEEWIALNHGFQSFAHPEWPVGIGTETKITDNSVSQLKLVASPNSELEAELVLCRLAGDVYVFRRFGSGAWAELDFDSDAADLTLPDVVQIGVMANAYGNDPDLRATFEYARFGVPGSVADCTADLPPI
jgi:hypothetical protein